MKTEIPPKVFADVCHALIHGDCKTATKYMGSKLVVRATWRHKPSQRNTCEEMVVTYGAPNYLEVKFIQDCFAAGEPLPVKKVQLKPWPKPKKGDKNG